MTKQLSPCPRDRALALADVHKAPRTVTSLHRPVGEDGSTELGDLLPSDERGPGEEIDSALQGNALRSALARLPERERAVIELRFGIGDQEPATLRETGWVVGLSSEGVRRLEARALKRLAGESELEAAAVPLDSRATGLLLLSRCQTTRSSGLAVRTRGQATARPSWPRRRPSPPGWASQAPAAAVATWSAVPCGPAAAVGPYAAGASTAVGEAVPQAPPPPVAPPGAAAPLEPCEPVDGGGSPDPPVHAPGESPAQQAPARRASPSPPAARRSAPSRCHRPSAPKRLPPQVPQTDPASARAYRPPRLPAPAQPNITQFGATASAGGGAP